MLRLVARWAPFVAACVTIAVLSQMGRPPLVRLPDFWQADKLLHAIAYAVVGVTAFVALGRDRAPETSSAQRRRALAAWTLTVLYGVSDEIHQSFVPGRHASVADVGADAIGAAIALAIVVASRRRRAVDAGASGPRGGP